MEPTPDNNPPSSPSKQVTGTENLDRLAFAALWLLGIFGGALAATAFLAARLETGLLWSTACFLGWGALVAAIHFLYLRSQVTYLRESGPPVVHFLSRLPQVTDLREGGPAEKVAGGNEPRIQREPPLPRFQTKGQAICLIVGGLTLLWVLIQGSLWMQTPLPADDATGIRLAGILFLAMAFGLYFIGQYVAFVQAQRDKQILNVPLYLARLGIGICLLAAACLFTFLYAKRDWAVPLGRSVGVVTILLIIDAWVRAGTVLLQPRALVKELPPLGGGVALGILFRRGSPWDALTHHLETSFGVKVGESWILPFLRRTMEPVILVGIVLAWLSTCLTEVPAQSQGVRVLWGQYLKPALGPGLHVTWPWPAETIAIVPTQRIEQIALGFEHDLGGPMLWTESHYEGELNLLVGNGEELLAISAPIFYRINDPLAYLQTTTNARAALINIAYRQLLAVTAARDIFGVMTVERQEISGALKQALQQEVDRMHLGLQIMYVGLKDIHPPVPVASAFQDVVSAEEKKLADLDGAAAYRYQTMAEAREQANRLKTTADALFKQRTDQAEGESARFLMLAGADAANTDLFRLRLRMEILEKALAPSQKLVITQGAASNDQFYLDMRGLGGVPLP